ncbi:cilia- and flagella-associated protein 73 isoform X2 [Sceloporus undulatus]|uniref:cilia- and flagella-associated protein 73 isoform X2 n=1 Tax=Sceloporus undulatus TaxID=8520 RepID=UPI001C4C6118|nr:cilia- and flagella-associated protein 73 isoform X2 [Sceloporus undulatus]
MRLLVCSRKIPEKEDDFLPSACLLLEKRRELAAVEQALVAKKEEFQGKMEELQERREELERKEGQLKQAILKFDKFLKESDAKRSRALRKASQEQLQAAQRGAEAERLQAEIARLVTAREKLQHRLAAHKAFPEYLQKVLEKTGQFEDIPDLIARFQTLMATQATLAQRELVAREAVEEEHACLQQYIEESSNQILQQNNQVAELQSQLDQIRTKVLELESNWICIQNTAANKTLELGKVKLAILNLFQMVAKYRKLPADVPPDDTEAQLDVVQLCIGDLTDILANFRKSEPTPVSQPEPVTASQSELESR